MRDVRNWLDNHPFAIHDLEAAYINEEHDDDLIPVHPKVRSLLRKLLEKTSVLRRRPLRAFLTREPCDPEVREKEGDHVVWHNDKRVEWLSAVVIGIVGLVMIIGPIWALYRVDSQSTRLGIISVFIVFFYILGVAITAKVFESLAAVAAYSAVLMVFMQIQGNAVGAMAG